MLAGKGDAAHSLCILPGAAVSWGEGMGLEPLKLGEVQFPSMLPAQPICCSSQEPQAGTILGLKTPKKSSQCSRLGLYLMLQRPCYL